MSVVDALHVFLLVSKGVNHSMHNLLNTLATAGFYTALLIGWQKFFAARSFAQKDS